MAICSFCGKVTDEFSTISCQDQEIPICGYCRKKISNFDNASLKEKEEIKNYLREKILMGKINKYSFPALDYCLGGEETEKLIQIAAEAEKPQEAKKISYYNAKVYAISLIIAIVGFIATFILFSNRKKDIIPFPYSLIVPFISLFSMLVASNERRKPRKK